MADWEAPFRLAVTVAVWLVVNVPALAVKPVLLAPAAAVTELGTVKAALLLASVIVAPPVGAAWFSVTVQFAAEPELRLLGLHATAVTTKGATSVKLAV